MSDLHEETIRMTPQISPKDIPQDGNETEEEEEPVYTNVVNESSSSGEDELEGMDSALQGYIPLSMNDANETSDDSSQETEENNNVSEGHVVQESQINENVNEISSPPVNQDISTKEVPMDSDQVNLIQQVMSRISLPSSSIPEWANFIPEDKWKNALLTSLEQRTHSSSSTKCDVTNPEK